MPASRRHSNLAVRSLLVNSTVAEDPLGSGGTLVGLGAGGAVRSTVNVRES